MKDIQIDQFFIGQNHKPFIIAEMSGNHNHSLQKALKIVDAAADAGAHAIKLQTYTADTMTIRGAYTVSDKNSLWEGRELYDLYKEAYTPWDWHQIIFDRAKERGLIPFSSPFDESAVDFLMDLNVPCFKIASFENTDLPLLRKVAQTGLPIIMSTGVSELSEIWESVKFLQENGCKELILLKCTSTYPAEPTNSNLLTIPHLSALFNCHVGLSDHTMGIGSAIAATALGAKVIEKHFTISRAEGGVDSAFSLEPSEMKSLVIETERAFQSLGDIQYGVQKSEKSSLVFKRSLYVVKDVEKGEKLTKDNVKVLRPGVGIKPKYFDKVLGKTVSCNIKAGSPLQWELINS